MDFLVSALRVNQGKGTLPALLLEELGENATYVRPLSLWLFEGDWETVLEPWLETQDIECLGDLVVPSLGGLSDSKLKKLVAEQIEVPPVGESGD